MRTASRFTIVLSGGMAYTPFIIARRAVAALLTMVLLYLLLWPRVPTTEISDYWAHMGAFGLWVWIMWTFHPGRPAWRLVASAIVLGVAIELVQPFVGRSSSVRDALANAAGALLAGGVIVLRRHMRERRA